MDAMSGNASSSVSSSPSSSPNLTAYLKLKIISWSQQTGFPVAIQVRVGGKLIGLHKLPLCSSSGYLRRHLSDTIVLPPDFPGGWETFEMIALFMYASSAFAIDPWNVASLRCAAEFLEMASLCERTDLYLNQVVLQNWDHTLTVLHKCQSLLPCAEELLIDSRCVESLAFMACMEILDPEAKRNQPGYSLESLAGLPFQLFRRVVCSLRRQGMKDKYVGPIVVLYADKCLANTGNGDQAGEILLQGILELLGDGHKAIPVGFYLSLLARSLELVGQESKSRNMVFRQIVGMLPLARVEDFLVPVVKEGQPVSSTKEFRAMLTIFNSYVSSNGQSPAPTRCWVVAELWDSYLALHAALDPAMEASMFLHLIQTVPLSYRRSHDQLYRAITAFLKAHPSLTQDEKTLVCQDLNIQKLSQEACIEAVQNELMPLRLVVQALIIQQMNTQQAFKECSESFRCTNTTLGGSSGPEILSKDYDSASFRIQSLEKQILSLKSSLYSQKLSKEATGIVQERLLSNRRNVSGEHNACIGSVSFTSQRRYAARILRVFRGFIRFARLKPKTRETNPGL